MYKLLIANKNYSSWSLRPWVLMKELNIPFEENLYPFGHSNFLDFSPSGKVPCLVDGDMVIWDSLAICEYLAESHGDVWPMDKQARAWARSAAAEMHSGFAFLRNECGMNVGVRVKLNEISSGLGRDLKRLNEVWNEGLTKFGGPFLAGEKFSAVDAFFAPVVFRCRTYNLPITGDAANYCGIILTLNSMQFWEIQALDEAWRDQDHELELKLYGDVIDDKRNL